MRLRHRETRPADPHHGLYRVTWMDRDGGHLTDGLSWEQADAEFVKHAHTVGHYGVRLYAQEGAR